MTHAFAGISDPAVADLSRAWRRRLSPTDLQVVDRAGYGRTIEPGARPALIVVDFQYAYVGDDKPILDQIEEWPTAGGQGAWDALRRAMPVLEAARAAGAPIVFSRIGYDHDDTTTNTFASKRGSAVTFALGHRGTELVETLGRRDGEVLLTKTAASVFYGTQMDQFLEDRHVDTLLVCGLSTSGCVRATVVDGAARGYRMITVADCVADRIVASHETALFDIWLKYGSLLSSDAAVAYLSSVAS